MASGLVEYRADHAIFLPRQVSHRGVRPVVHNEEALVFQAEGSYWCDPLSVVDGEPCHASYFDVLGQYGDLAKGKPFEACGHTLHVSTGERVAWADEVARLDIDRAIWAIGVPDFPNYREFDSDDDRYWVGAGPCANCPTGVTMAIKTMPHENVMLTCPACNLFWQTPLDAAEGIRASSVSLPDDFRIATAGEVASDRQQRFELLLNAEARNQRSLEHWRSELWTIRPRSSLPRRRRTSN